MEKVLAPVLYARRKIRTETFPIPKVGPREALVKMVGAAICGTDKHVFDKGEIRLGLPGDVVKFPVILGHENLGVIEEVGSDASKEMVTEGGPLTSGERVVISADIVCGTCYYCRNIFGFPWCLNHRSYGDVISCKDPPHLFGGMAEKMFVLPGTFMFRVPRRMPDEIAVLTEQMAVAYGAFGRAFQNPNPKEGYSPADAVVVQGVGPLGMCNAVMARMLGASKIIAIDKSPYRLKIARSLCNAETIDLAEHPRPEDRVEAVLSMTDRLGADTVIECTGFPHIISEGLDLMRNGGTYLVEGAYSEDEGTTISASRQILAKNARIIGVSGMPFPAYSRALKMMESYRNAIHFEKLVSHVFAQEDAQEAMRISMGLDSMKVVVGRMKG
ncbi:MAG: alcohol dehydrogenase catalytic domain-containing protein [Thaumarchaeota archaeon]|nr:alcohol dehydrogenase catalytic domain-containing protein [Nitrososphaerota archaeon]